MSSSSSSSSAASASAVFPPSPQSQTPPPPLLVVENNLPPLNQLGPPPVAAAPASEQLCYVHCHFCDTVLVVSVPTSSLFKTVTVRCGHCNGLLTVNMRGLLIPGTPTTSTAAAAATPATSVVTTSTTATTLITTPPPVVSSANNNNGQFLRFPNSVSLVPNPLHHHSILEEISSVNPTSLQLLEQNRLMTPGARTAAAPAPPPQLRAGKGATEPSPRTNNNGAVLNRPPEKRQRVPSAYNRFIKDEIQRIKAGNPDISHREAFSAAAKNWAHFPHIHFGLMPDPHGLMKTNPLTQDRKDSGLLKEGLYAAAAAAAANMGVAPY